MLGDPGGIVAETVGFDDFRRHPFMDIAMRVGLGIVIGVRREQDTEFHASSFPNCRAVDDAALMR
jgi:hypothetical protein